MVELLDLGPLWFAQSLENGGRVRYRASDDLAYTLLRLVGRQRGTAIGDKPVKVEHGHIPSAEAVVRVLPRFGERNFRTRRGRLEHLNCKCQIGQTFSRQPKC